MSGFDRTSTYVTKGLTSGLDMPFDSNTEIINRFKKFILDFRYNNNSSYIYREQLRNNLLLKQFFLQVNIDHIINYNDDLYRHLVEEPTDIIPLFEEAVNEAAKRIAFSVFNNTDKDSNINSDLDPTSQAMLDGGLADSDVLYDLNNGVACQLILDGGQNDLASGNVATDNILNEISGGDSNIVTNEDPNSINPAGNSTTTITPIRQLNSTNVSKMVRISGIIVSASVLSSRAAKLNLVCRTCRHTMKVSLNNFNSLSGSAQSRIPRSCQSNKNDMNSTSLNTMSGQYGSAQQITAGDQSSCGNDPYMIIHEASQFIDQQYLKIQELPESVPVGEMPRTILMTCDRYLTNKLIPGTRVNILGIYSIYQSKANSNTNNNGTGSSGRYGGGVAIRNPYMKMVGMNLITAGGRIHSLGDDDEDVDGVSQGYGLQGNSTPLGVQISDSDEQKILEFSRNPRVYEILKKSLASSIFGNDDIKRAILCLLFGGSKKILPDGMRLRGDVNVLMLGDPGTAKSQLLKFVEKVAPVSVYTSGKGSSAAGLTASVQRDPNTRDFYLEGGAMVLADGGVVCIDEFDKMRDEDRVAIHEAMEQQTISVAKAGITTVLNSRTSVLAAANPIYGRYNDAKSPGENIDFQTTILSRFDMIFIVKDTHNEERDRNIANHVMNIHTGRNNENDENRASDGEQSDELSLEFFKKYIAYCKTRCAPRLTPDASQRLVSHFVDIRKKVYINEVTTKIKSTIPITIRQLEAIIRISESLAKMQLNPVATEEHVAEAIRLFQASTMDAASYDMDLATAPSDSDQSSYNPFDEIKKLEEELKRRFPIGYVTNYTTLKKEFVEKRNFKQGVLDRALHAMEARDMIQFSNQRQKIHRTGL
ncbi:hypothetical protein QEN19_000421 [Hanseniaspora menglaensis]